MTPERRSRFALVPLLLFPLAVPAAADGPPAHDHAAMAATAPMTPESAPAAPLFDDLGSYHRAITTVSPEAQRYFDQGLRLMYAFNLEEAQRSFEAAARLDPECASCFWGVALALGPHINMAAQADRTRAAHQAVAKAQALAGRATEAERALAAALATRYADPPPADAAGQKALDTAYAEAMRDVARRFPDDLDAAALYAEALMDLRPWDLWTPDGKPQPGTEEIVATLERVLAKDPTHPGANHYYVHAVEASPHPERAVASAERLPGLIPGAAHIVHMPSHIFARTGRWEEASEANRRAIAVDRKYIEKTNPQGFYLMYVAHNFQFLWSTAYMQGRGAEALENARAVVAQAPPEMLRMMPGLDFVLEYPVWTLVGLGRFEEALAEPAPPEDFAYATAVRHAARGIALARLGRAGEAAKERELFAAAAARVPAEATEAVNSARTLLAVAENLLAGELAAAKGDAEGAVARFQQAVRAEDELRYDEPPDWYLPARHALGRALAQAGRAKEAQAVWEEDLRRHPENGWALAGLAGSLRAQKKDAEAAQVGQRFEKAWSRADVPAPTAGGTGS